MSRRHLVFAQEGVAVPGGVHVLVPIQDQAHWTPQLPRRDGRSPGERQRTRLLATKAPSDALCAGHNLVSGDAQALSHNHPVVPGTLHG